MHRTGIRLRYPHGSGAGWSKRRRNDYDLHGKIKGKGHPRTSKAPGSLCHPSWLDFKFKNVTADVFSEPIRMGVQPYRNG